MAEPKPLTLEELASIRACTGSEAVLRLLGHINTQEEQLAAAKQAHEKAEDLVGEWQESSMLVDGAGDPATTTPADNEKNVKALGAERDALTNQLTRYEERLSNCFGYPGGPGNPDDCSSCLLRARCTQAIGTEADFQRVCIERDALQTVLSAWHEAFGTTQLTHALAEREALQAIVDRLPKTADGVPVVPGMALTRNTGVWVVAELVTWQDGRGWRSERWSDCYSTREAAGAAVQNAIDKADRAAAEAAKETDDG